MCKGVKFHDGKNEPDVLGKHLSPVLGRIIKFKSTPGCDAIFRTIREETGSERVAAIGHMLFSLGQLAFEKSEQLQAQQGVLVRW